MTISSQLNGVHATLIAQHGQGILLVGPSGSGKSRYALQQLSMDNQLVSDDLVLLHTQKGKLLGTAPKKGLGWLHLHTQGFINVRQRFGQQALLPSAFIAQVYHFDPAYYHALYLLNGIQLPCCNMAHLFV